MSLADSLRLSWAATITDSSYRRSFDKEQILKSTANTVVASSSNGFDLYCGNPKDASALFSHDANRLASAAFESILSGGRIDAHPKSTAWLIVRCYYAAFFSFHCLLRLQGIACTRISGSSLVRVNSEIGVLGGQAQPLAGGMYSIEVQSDARTLSFTKLGNSLGGTHEALWTFLPQYLQGVVGLWLKGQADDHKDAIVLIDSFQRVMEKWGGYQWFTRFRNRVNYAQGYGAWFPYIGSTTDYDRLHLKTQDWAAPPRTLVVSAEEVSQFVESCAFLVSLCSTTVRDISFRSVSNSPFRKSSGLLLGR